jgi:hypothetical protein
MIVFEVSSITAVRDSNGGRTLHGFNVIGINAPPRHVQLRD